MRATHAIHFAAALLALSNTIHAARILGLFPHTGRSHQMVFEPLLHKLAERGHHVTVVSFFPIQNPPANYTDISLEGLAEVGLEIFDLNAMENSPFYLQIPMIDRTVLQMAMFAPLSGLALEVCSKLVDFKPLAAALKKEYDVILVENFNSDCMLGLLYVYDNKAPTVSLLSTGLMQWSADRIGVSDNPSYVPMINAPFTSRMSFLERLENTFDQIYFKLWFRYAIQVKEQELIEKHFGRKIPDLKELAKKTTMMITNTFHSVNGAKPLLPGIVEAGGMHLNPDKKAIPAYIEKFLNESEHGVVLFSYGSLIKTSTIPKFKEDMLVNVLSKLKQRIIWKYEGSDEEGTLTGNILRVKWLPQYELLHHKKVVAFIAHGGLLGMTEAISAGKPILIMPFFGDQPYNGATAIEAGYGTVVSYIGLTEESLAEGLRKVLSAEMRVSARRVSKIWHDRQAPPLDTAVYWVERVARWGNSSPLSSAAKELSFIEYTLIDIAATFILAILILLVVLNFIFKMMLRLIAGSLSHEGKRKLH